MIIRWQTNNFIKCIDCTLGIAKWFVLQIFLYFLMPYLWNYEYGVGAIVSMSLYTAFYVVYWEFVPKDTRLHWFFVPYLVYCIIATVLFYVVDNWIPSLWICWILPFYGLACLFIIKLLHKLGIPNKFHVLPYKQNSSRGKRVKCCWRSGYLSSLPLSLYKSLYAYIYHYRWK